MKILCYYNSEFSDVSYDFTIFSVFFFFLGIVHHCFSWVAPIDGKQTTVINLFTIPLLYKPSHFAMPSMSLINWGLFRGMLLVVDRPLNG